MKLIEDYLSESARACNTPELSEALGLTKSNIYMATELMRGFGVVDRMKGGVKSFRYYYFLKDRYSEEEIAEMIPKREVKVPRPKKPRVRRKPGRPRKKTEAELFMDSYLGDIEKRASTATDGLTGLAILGLPDIDSVRPTRDTVKPETSKLEPVPELGIKMFATLKVKELSKNVRRLPQTELNYLKNIFKQYSWFPVIENLQTGYAKFKAMKTGRYGDTIHFSKGSNPWEDVISIKVGTSISSDLFMPMIETKRWQNWNEFNAPPRAARSYQPGGYGIILNEFIDSGNTLVEITSNRPPIAMRTMLNYHVKRKGLQAQIAVTRVQDYVYLEKMS